MTVSGNVVTVTPSPGFTGPIRLLVGVKDQGATTRGSTQDPFDTQLITIGVGDLPIVATGVLVAAIEGAPPAGVTVATFIDQDPNPVATDFTASINWGDGHVSGGTVTLGPGGTLTVTGTNTYKEAGLYQVRVTITDRLGAVATPTTTATVVDAQLSAQGVPITAGGGVPFSNLLVATFTDNDPNATVNDFTATINWGDGTSSAATITTGAANAFSVLGSHTYSTQGNFTVGVALNDVNPAGDVPGSTASTTSSATVQQASATTTVLTASPSGPVVFGQTVVLTATVANSTAGGGTPTGTVTFLDGTTSLGNGTLDASGTATLSTAALSAGSAHALTAMYNGAGVFMASTSAPFSLTVTKASTTITVTASPNPATTGQATTFTAIVSATGTGSGTPTGTVTFQDGTTTLGTGTLDGQGHATFSTSTLATGQRTITAVYAGDGNFNTITSTPLNLTVNAAPVGTNQSYVTQLYRDLLGREPDSQGLNSFITALSQNTFTRAQVVKAMINTDEARTHAVQNLYQLYLGRAADTRGLDLSLRFLKTGGPLQKIRTVIVGSNEYFQSRSGSNNTTFLSNVYRDVLGRVIDSVGQSLGGQALTAGTERAKVADVVFKSPEGMRFLVQSYYTQLLHRTADPVGLNASTAALAHKTIEQQIPIEIASSDEYFRRS